MYFIYLEELEREGGGFCLLVHSTNSQGWTRLKPGELRGLRGSRTSATLVCLPMHSNREVDTMWSG